MQAEALSYCPEAEFLLASVSAAQDSPEAATIAMHIESCETCEHRLRVLLLESDEVFLKLRGSSPLAPYSSEEELQRLLVQVEKSVPRNPPKTGFAATTAVGFHEDASVGARIPALSFPGYVLLEEISSGGMGVVFRARQPALDRQVALKMILPDKSKPRLLERFRVESTVIARLQHPHVIQIIDFGEVDGQPYFTMELMAGGDLAQRLHDHPMDEAEAAELLAVLADAVHYSHEMGVLHRDIKPSNVLFTREDIPKIGDFGLAKLLTSESRIEETHEDAVLGTPAYMAPEQARGRQDQVGRATDVYGLGALLYHALTGVPPFQGDNKLETLAKVSQDPVAPPSALRPKLCRELEAICLKCLQKQPAARYPDAHSLAEDLRSWRQGRSTQARQEKRVRFGLRMLAAAASVALVAGLAWAFAPTDRAARRTIENNLAAGLPTELQDDRGDLLYSRIIGETEARLSSGGANQSFRFSSIESAIAVMVEDPQCEAYRVYAEVRHAQAFGVGSGTGVVVGLQRVSMHGHSVYTGCIMHFNDIEDHRDIGRLLAPAIKAQGLAPPEIPGNLLSLVPYVLVRGGGLLEPFHAMLPGQDHYFLAGRSGDHWRRVELEVRPRSLTARWDDQPALHLDVVQLEADVEQRMNILRERFGSAPTAPYSFNPRGAIGVMSRNGATAFRKVVVEPLFDWTLKGAPCACNSQYRR